VRVRAGSAEERPRSRSPTATAPSPSPRRVDQGRERADPQGRQGRRRARPRARGHRQEGLLRRRAPADGLVRRARPAPVKVIVEVVRVADAVSVRALDQGLVPPNEQRSYSWDGLPRTAPSSPTAATSSASTPRTPRACALLGAGLRGAASPAPPPDSFMLLGHKFPIRGAHDYGRIRGHLRRRAGPQGPGRLRQVRHAARRGPRRHGEIKQFHDRAGHYVVIDGARPTSTTSTCTSATPRWWTRAPASTPAS
jgi:hypothetical protein